jgi:hypothetical protein
LALNPSVIPNLNEVVKLMKLGNVFIQLSRRLRKSVWYPLFPMKLGV